VLRLAQHGGMDLCTSCRKCPRHRG
jgi:hypothetical protein